MEKQSTVQHEGKEMTQYAFGVEDFISTARCNKVVAAYNWEWIFCREAAPFIVVRTTDPEFTREIALNLIISSLGV